MMMLAFGTISSNFNALSIPKSSAVNIEESSISLMLVFDVSGDGDGWNT
jgi:hypothetical protein